MRTQTFCGTYYQVCEFGLSSGCVEPSGSCAGVQSGDS
jgi:hypothetical protein